MARKASAASNAGNETGHTAKDVLEQQQDGPLHFRAGTEFVESAEAKEVIRGAKSATEKEYNMTLMQGVRLYPKAVFWSVLISTCIAMEGYDVCLINNFYGFPAFQRKYGEKLGPGSYQLTAPWQSGLSNGANCGEFIGLLINGWVSERFGYRYVRLLPRWHVVDAELIVV